jgi:hypothetical protein
MYYLVSIPMFFGCLWILLLSNVRAKASSTTTAAAGRAIA